MYQDIDRSESLSKALRLTMILQQTEQMWKEFERQIPNHLVPDGRVCFCGHYEGEHMEEDCGNPIENQFFSDVHGFLNVCQFPGCNCIQFTPEK